MLALDAVGADIARDDPGRTVVMVTRDPGAAAHADLVFFPVDGRIADEMPRPAAEAVPERMRVFPGADPRPPEFDVVRGRPGDGRTAQEG